jgi:hypothetical protein
MKAKNTKTGEVVTNFGISKEFGTISYVDSKGFLRISSPNSDEWEIIEETETDNLRQQAAIAAMQGILSNADGFVFKFNENEYHTIPIGVARLAIACADELIKQLNE